MSSRYWSRSDRAGRSSQSTTVHLKLEFELDRLLRRLPVLIHRGPGGVLLLGRDRAFGRPVLFCPNGSVSAKLLEIAQDLRLAPIYRDFGSRAVVSGGVPEEREGPRRPRRVPPRPGRESSSARGP
jgi:hypothetical protein